jgi:hypothetical protein
MRINDEIDGMGTKSGCFRWLFYATVFHVGVCVPLGL